MAQDFVSTVPSSGYNLLQCATDSRENETVLRSQFAGTSFPDNPITGQPCYRIDMAPAKLYIFNGINWVESDTASTVGTDIRNCYGTMKSLYDRLNTSLNPDGTLKTNVVSNISEWLSNISLNPAYVSANCFTVSGDYTGVLTTGRAIKSISGDNAIQYSFVVSSVYDATTKLTTVNVTANVLDNTLTEIEYGTIQFSAMSPGGGNLQGAINETTVSLASAATMNIGAAAGNVIVVTGNTTITAFDTAQAGTRRTLKFTQALIMTYNAISLILPGAANISVSAGDVMEFISEGSDVWQCINYAPSVGYATIPQVATISSIAHQRQNNTTYSIGDIAYSPNLPSWARIECVATGKTAMTEPIWPTTAGQYITDGAAKWIVDDVRDGNCVGDIVSKLYIKAGYIKANGSSVNRADYPRLLKFATDHSLFYDDGTRNFTGTTVVGSTTISGISTTDVAKLWVGMTITGTGIAVNTVITAVSTTSITISNAATAAGTSVTLGFGNISNFPALFGNGDGNITFVLPDWRGVFLRFLDDDKGLDSGRPFASYQSDAFQGHWHIIQGRYSGGGQGNDINMRDRSSIANSANDRVINAVTDGVNGVPRTAIETRPKNIAMYPLIKY